VLSVKGNRVEPGKGAPSAVLALREEVPEGAADRPVKWQATRLFPTAQDDGIFRGDREKGGSDNVLGMHDDMGDGRWGA
jgi:hypothetical protein